MTSTTRVAAGCIAAAAVAGLVALSVGNPFAGDGSPAGATTAAATPTAAITPTVAATTSAATADEPTVPVPTPLTMPLVAAAVPAPDEEFEGAAGAVHLSSVCAGASLDLTRTTPMYVSLQTTAEPLEYLDATLAVYDDPAAAQQAYADLATAIAACPTNRTVTPSPPSTGTPGPPIVISGVAIDVVGAARPTVQWVQLETVQSPPAELRTAVTVTQVANVVVLVALDQDSATATEADLTAASLARAESVAEQLAAAAGGG